MVKLNTNIIKKWHATIDKGADDFLDFMEGMHLNECRLENGERCMYFEDGNHYIAHGYRMGEYDGDFEKDIIDYYEECGGEYASN